MRTARAAKVTAKPAVLPGTSRLIRVAADPTLPVPRPAPVTPLVPLLPVTEPEGAPDPAMAPMATLAPDSLLGSVYGAGGSGGASYGDPYGDLFPMPAAADAPLLPPPLLAAAYPVPEVESPAAPQAPAPASPAQPGAGAPPVQAVRLRPLPAPPAPRPVTPPPTRDLAAEQNQRGRMGRDALGVGLLAAALGGGENALRATGALIPSVLAAAEARQDATLAERIREWGQGQQAETLEDARAQQAYAQETAGINAENANALRAAAQAQAAQDRADRLAEKREADAAAARERRNQNVLRAARYLADLQTDEERESALRSGALSTLFDLDEEGVRALASAQKFQKPARTPEQEQAAAAQRLLLAQYRLFENPRLSPDDAKKTLANIDQLQRIAGLPAGLVPDGVLAELSPEARERIGVAQQGVDVRKKAQAEAERHNREMEAQGRTRLRQAEQRLAAANARAAEIKNIRDPSHKIFALTQAVAKWRSQWEEEAAVSDEQRKAELRDPQLFQKRSARIKGWKWLIDGANEEVSRLREQGRRYEEQQRQRGAGTLQPMPVPAPAADGGAAERRVTLPGGRTFRVRVIPNGQGGQR